MLVAALTGCADESGAGLATYRSAEYGFRFNYPDSLDVREYTPTIIALGRGDDDGFDAVAEIILEVSEDVGFDALAIERARTSCAADGPGQSQSCTGVLESQSFSTSGGEVGIAFDLRHVTTIPGEETILEESSRGPFHALDVTDAISGGAGVLFIKPPTVLEAERVDRRLIEEIARSVSF